MNVLADDLKNRIYCNHWPHPVSTRFCFRTIIFEQEAAKAKKTAEKGGKKEKEVPKKAGKTNAKRGKKGDTVAVPASDAPVEEAAALPASTAVPAC